MYKKNAKWLILGILIVILFTTNSLSSSKYVETLNKQIALSIRKPIYTVKFHPNNGGEDNFTTQDVTYGTPQNLDSNCFIKDGFIFKEWNTAADGSGNPYLDEEEVENLSNLEGDVIDLYAIWTVPSKCTYKVIHKKMDLDGVNYTTAGIEEIEADPGDIVTPIPKFYTGFDMPTEQTATVAADGSTTVTYLYERKQFHVTIVNDDLLTISDGITSGYYYYGQPIQIEFTPDVPGVSFIFDGYLITQIDEENNRTITTLNDEIINITVEDNTIIEPEFSSYPVAYFKAFNGTPWLNGSYAQNHTAVYNQLYTDYTNYTGNGPLRDPDNPDYDEYMFGDINNPTNGLSKKGITEFKRNTTKTMEEIEAMYNAGTAMLVSNEVDDGYLSPVPVYAWIEGTTMYWDSLAYIVKFHPDTVSAFYCMTEATRIDLTNTDTSLVKNFNSFFNSCLHMTEIKGFINTNGVVDPESSDTFNYAGDNSTDSSSKQGMSYMFNDCKALLSLDVSKFNTTNVVDMKRMFAGCANIQNLDLFSFDTSNVKSMYWMFRNCKKLTELRLTSFNTTNLKNSFGMFFNANSLKTIYLGDNFQTPNLVNCSQMFQGCQKLETIYAQHDFDRTKASSHANMFKDCTKLIGGRDTDYETPFNSSIIDKRYAQISNENQNGYFTSNVQGTKYYINYNLNGGTAENRTYYFNTSPSFSLSRPTKEGYIFTGWTGSNGDTPELDITISQGSTGDRNYTANYEPITYRVRFYPNGGTGTTMPAQEFTYDIAQTLRTNTYTNESRTFLGWNTLANGSGIDYADQESVSNLSSTEGDVVNLYAQWSSEAYKITYNYGTYNFTGNNFLNSGLKLFDPTYKNKDFDISFNASNVTYVTNGDKKDALVVCQLEGTTPYPGFSLSYFGSNDSNYANQIRLQANTSSRGQRGLNLADISISPPDLGLIHIKRIENKLYLNSTVVKDNNNADINFADINKNMDIVPLTFGANVDQNSPLSPRRFVKATMTNINVKFEFEETELEDLTLPTPIFTGHTFDGWYTQPNGEGTKITSGTQITNLNTTLYANWISQ